MSDIDEFDDGFMVRLDRRTGQDAGTTMWNGRQLSHAVICLCCEHTWGRHHNATGRCYGWEEDVPVLDDACDCPGWEPMRVGAYSEFTPPPSLEPHPINAGGRALRRRPPLHPPSYYLKK